METKQQGYQFNTFCGVFLPSILTILGVVMFMRLGTIVGNLGILGTIGILIFAESIAIATGLSISSISTNTPVRSGGPYFLISRALGPGFGASIGLTYYLSQSLSVPFYTIGFTEAMVTVFPTLAPYQLWVCLIPLFILFGIALVGADWAIRTQYFIMVVLGVSIIVMFYGASAAGPTLFRMQENLFATPGMNLNLFVIAGNFAIFFPAVTGFLAGVNMSGDLANARKSIPRGTLIAIGVGCVIYVAEILLFGATWNREILTANTYGTLVTSAGRAWFLVFAGVAAATLSSALGTLLDAPRILQAFAADRIFPVLNVFSKGHGKNNDPANAMILTLIMSIGVILWGNNSEGNTLNTVAELVTMFTLCTYAIINISAAMEHFAANPSFRPRFRLFHWGIGCYGAIASLIAALLINPTLLVVALIVVCALFLLACRKSLVQTFGDARRGFYFERMRRIIVRLEKLPKDARNWRPQLLVLAGRNRRHKALIRLGALLNNNRGILLVLRIIQTTFDISEREKESQMELQQMKDTSKKMGTVFFPKVLSIANKEDFDNALDVFLQTYASGPMFLNIVLSGWPSQPDRIPAFFRNLATIHRLNMNSLILMNPEWVNSQLENGTIDVWWRGQRNGSLMLVLAHLLACNPEWSDSPVRLIRTAKPEEEEEAKKELSSLAEAARIDAQFVVLTDGEDFTTALHRESANARIVFLGYATPKDDEIQAFYDRISKQMEGMPATFLVESVGDTSLNS